MKNVKLIDFKSVRFGGYNFVGYPRSTYPGKTSENKKIEARIKKDNKKLYERYKKLFRGNNKNTVFLTHNCPYNTKLDKVKKGPQKGEHYGSWLVRKIAVHLRPRLIICGHMHENVGREVLGRSLVVNAGAAYEGRAAIVELGKKVKIRFIK
jgi:Icc-related predicted phosphoesterase